MRATAAGRRPLGAYCWVHAAALQLQGDTKWNSPRSSIKTAQQGQRRELRSWAMNDNLEEEVLQDTDGGIVAQDDSLCSPSPTARPSLRPLAPEPGRDLGGQVRRRHLAANFLRYYTFRFR